MLDTIFSANSGLQSFSKGLNVISDNVTNVNTIGYKATNLQYRDIHYNYSLRDEAHNLYYGAQIGGGVAADVTSIVFNQGDLRSTTNPTDLAISGYGFFVIDRGGEYVYSRNGQFEFNDNGDLVTREGGFKVLGLGSNGKLQPINKNGFEAQQPSPTTKVDLLGNLSPGSSSATINDLNVIDPLGGSHLFKVTLTRDTTGTGRNWTVAVVDENNLSVGISGTISFQENGSPAPGANTYSFVYQASGMSAQYITLNFGDPNSFSNVTGFSLGTVSNVTVNAQDGHAAGTLQSLTFDAKGRLTANFSNQQVQYGPQLALARFDNLQALIQLGDGLFKPQKEQTALIGPAGSGAFGSIAAGQLESSNVDLTQQFSDMIIIQRGYQASSQVLTAANEMLQQLLEMGKR